MWSPAFRAAPILRASSDEIVAGDGRPSRACCVGGEQLGYLLLPGTGARNGVVVPSKSTIAETWPNRTVFLASVSPPDCT
jgi:hypothetical protein